MARWSGKIIGGGLGWVFGGPVGAILGTFAGAFFDKTSISFSSFQYEIENFRGTNKSPEFISSIIGILLSVAKADGKICNREVDVMERTFLGLGYQSDDLLYIKNVINNLSKTPLNLQESCLKYKRLSSYPERLLLLKFAYIVAISDDVFHPNKDNVIKQIVWYLGIHQSIALQIRSEFIKESSKNYEIFGLSKNASKSEINQAYRNLSKKYHPDKVAHLGDEFTSRANDKFQEINKAYQEIRREKGF